MGAPEGNKENEQLELGRNFVTFTGYVFAFPKSVISSYNCVNFNKLFLQLRFFC